jgi:hypothetical protein
MINKKNLLGKQPFDLGDKDAIHVAIVAVRAGAAISPGQRCGLNENREAVPNEDGCGVADPFLRTPIARGTPFWLLMDLQEIPNVAHTWDHPTLDFSPPVVEVQKNRWLQRYADEYGVTYEQLMDACKAVLESDTPVPYPGTKAEEDINMGLIDTYDIWSEWSGETGYEFYNVGSECCPEYEYPEGNLFSFND